MNCSRTPPRRVKTAWKHGRISLVVRRLLISTVLATTLVTTTVPAYATDFRPSVTDTVQVPQSELNELLAGVDSLILERRLLQIDLKATRQKAQIDSVLFADRLRLREENRDSWFVRAMKHPVMDAVYFVLGVYVGTNVITIVR